MRARLRGDVFGAGNIESGRAGPAGPPGPAPRAGPRQSGREPDEQLAVLHHRLKAAAARAPMAKEDLRHGARQGRTDALRKVQRAATDAAGHARGYFAADIASSLAGKEVQHAGELRGSQAIAAAAEASRAALSAQAAAERHGPAPDEVLTRNIHRLGSRFQGRGVGEVRARAAADEAELQDIDMTLWEDKSQALTAQAAARKRVEQAMSRERKEVARERRCEHCLGGDAGAAMVSAGLVLSIGEHCAVCVPLRGTCVLGQLAIVPREHVVSMTSASPAAYAEANQYKAAVAAMWAESGQAVVFTEIARRAGDAGTGHARVDAIPLPAAPRMDEFDPLGAPVALGPSDARTWFTAAFESAEPEAARTHRPVLELTGRGLNRVIPPGFPYVAVQWQGGGIAHVIESTKAERWTDSWAVDIVASALATHGAGRPRSMQYTRALQLAQEEAAQIRKRWAAYDPARAEQR